MVSYAKFVQSIKYICSNSKILQILREPERYMFHTLPKKTYFYWLTLLSFTPCRSPLCFCSIRHISPRHVAAEVLCQGIVDVLSPSALPYIEPSDDECASALACPPSVMLTAVTAAHIWTDINHES